MENITLELRRLAFQRFGITLKTNNVQRTYIRVVECDFLGPSATSHAFYYRVPDTVTDNLVIAEFSGSTFTDAAGTVCHQFR
jgi:hypothetical protein